MPLTSIQKSIKISVLQTNNFMYIQLCGIYFTFQVPKMYKLIIVIYV